MNRPQGKTNGIESRPAASGRALQVWSSDALDTDAVVKVLQEHFDVVKVLEPGAFNTLADGSVGLLIWQDPVVHIARLMIQGTPPETALRQWMDQAEEIQAAYRHNRRAIRVMGVDAIVQQPAALLQHFDLPNTPQKRSLLSGLSTGREAMNPLLRSLARLSLLSDKKAARLADGLEAISLVPNPAPPEIQKELGSALAQYHKALSALAGKNLLEAQAQQAQESLEALHAFDATRKHQLAVREQSLAALGDEVRNLEARVSLLQNALEQSTRDLQHVVGSRSYRLTRPLRQAKSLMSGRNDE